MTDSRIEMGAGAPLRAEAIAWFTRLRGDETDSLREEFAAWCARSPAHEQAYRDVAVLFERSAVLKHSVRFGRDATMPARSRSWLMGLALAAAVAGLALFGLAILRPHFGPAQPAPGLTAAQPLATARGEIRTFRLADGSRVTLDTASRIEVSIGTRERRLRLRAGRARIAVATDARPFVVEAGAGQVTSAGGTLDVAYGGADRIDVTLRAGAAEAGPSLQQANYAVPVKRLITGEPASFRADDFSDVPVAEARTKVDDGDWPSGWAEFRAISLAGLTAQANRYGPAPIVIDDPELGALSVSGRFRLTDSEALARRLAEVFDLRLRKNADGTHLGRAE